MSTVMSIDCKCNDYFEEDKKEITNIDGKLVCQVSKKRGFIEIVRKGCTTLICFPTECEFKIVNIKSAE